MHAFGFFRPYATDRGGVSPEPWHLSYAPVAQAAAGQLTVEELAAVLGGADIEGKEQVLEALERNYHTYIVNVDPPPAAALMSPMLA
jgi:hypothetical protein